MLLEVLNRIHDCAPSKSGLTWSTLYIKALSGDLADSPLLRDLSLSVRKLSSDKMALFLSTLSTIQGLDLGSAVSDLAVLTNKANPASFSSSVVPDACPSGPLRSEYDSHHSTVRTTVISQKVALTRHKAELSAADAAYSRFVTRIDLLLKNFFSAHLTSHPPSLSIPFSEVLIFDSGKSAVSHALSGAPRAAVERALARPADYLACECCDVEEGRLVGSAPATSVVWQLVGEGGVLVNVEDLWRAFQAVVEPEADEDRRNEKGKGSSREAQDASDELDGDVVDMEEEGAEGGKEDELLYVSNKPFLQSPYYTLRRPVFHLCRSSLLSFTLSNTPPFSIHLPLLLILFSTPHSLTLSLSR